jgi:hypothetical protein
MSAVAAGETPSPEMVAVARETERVCAGVAAPEPADFWFARRPLSGNAVFTFLDLFQSGSPVGLHAEALPPNALRLPTDRLPTDGLCHYFRVRRLVPVWPEYPDALENAASP